MPASDRCPLLHENLELHLFGVVTQLQVPPQAEIFQALNDPKIADIIRRYFQSKLMVMQCLWVLARRLSASGDNKKHHMVMKGLNPRWSQTEPFCHDDGGTGCWIYHRLIVISGEVGSRTLAPAVESTTESVDTF